jgi:hypothetical protein
MREIYRQRIFPTGIVMCSLEKVSFAVAALGVVLSLGIAKRRRTKEVASKSDLMDFLDWVDAESEIHEGSELGFLTPDEGSPVHASDNALHRSLAAVGLAATSPRQARPKATSSTRAPVHPASGNDELADDVVRVKRVSEAEEAKRYFSAFSYFSS